MSVTKKVKRKRSLMKRWMAHGYQLVAIAFLLLNRKSALFLDPGLGKTSTSLATIRILKFLGRTKGVLMVAPLRVCYSVWPQEIKKWYNFRNLKCCILHGKTLHLLNDPSYDIYLINPEGLPWLMEMLLHRAKRKRKMPFDTLWIDESTKFKSPNAKNRFELVKIMLPLFKRRHVMTGTPAPRSLMDLWSQMYILDEGKALEKNFYHFRNKYFFREEYNEHSWFLKSGSAELIKDAIAPMVLEMSAADYLKLPEIIYNDINVELPTKAMKQYKEMEEEFFVEIDDAEISAKQTATASMKCHQIANGHVYEDVPEGLDEAELRHFKRNRKAVTVHKAKVEALVDLVEELNGKPLLIAYQYKHDLKALRDALGHDLPHIGSGVSPKQSDVLAADWNAGKLPLLAGHPSSMAHGLNLQGAGNDICWFSQTWNLEEYLQLIARLHRQGVRGDVRVHHLIAKNTLDEVMMMRLNQKAAQQKSLRAALKEYRSRNMRS